MDGWIIISVGLALISVSKNNILLQIVTKKKSDGTKNMGVLSKPTGKTS